MQKPTVKVACVQYSSDLGAVEANRSKLLAACETAAANGAKIVVLPEMAITGYLSQDLETNWHKPPRPQAYEHSKNPKGFAETCPGPSTELFAQAAKRLSLYITVPLLEVEERTNEAGETLTTYYNTAAVVGPTGEFLGRYRKNNPWPTPEQSYATHGTDELVIDTEYGKVGVAICFDIHTMLARYARHHIWALLYPIAWVGEPKGWFREGLPEMLAKCKVPHYIFGANWSTDKEEEWPGAGWSFVMGPWGRLVGGLDKGTGDDILYADVPYTPKEEQEKANNSDGSKPQGKTLDLDMYERLCSHQRYWYDEKTGKIVHKRPW
eukprot:TRINITY_DN49388_c0_g1_i1.p1 TRINITY_DN49388_c0_g1~~TRINITY_DN49388_c0_g1_i1.p1  ORF type:complete len:323 (-),score=39.79 TRINITY_DN49388_c0_g1_i1:134-1102(-)